MTHPTTNATPPQPAAGGLILRVLQAATARHALLPALWYRRRTTRYRALSRRIEERAARLAQLGLAPGDHVLVVMPGCTALIDYLFAVWETGAAVRLLDPGADIAGLQRELARHPARLLVTLDRADCQNAARMMRVAGVAGQTIVVPTAAMLPWPDALAFQLFGKRRGVGRSASPQPEIIAERALLARPRTVGVASRVVDPSAPALIVPSDTAAGEQVPTLTQGGLHANLEQCLAALPPFTEGRERVLAAVPLHEPVALALAVHVTLAQGGELVVPAAATFGAVMAAARKRAPTILIAAAPLLGAMVDDERAAHAVLRAARVIVTVGGPLPVRLRGRLRAVTAATVVETYGARGVVATLSTLADRADDNRDPLPGRLLPGTRAIVCDLADPARALPNGERGSVHLAGPQFPDAGLGRDFHATGDVGLIAPDGRLVVLDRVEDLIVAAGYLIYPSRIENALAEHPDVIEQAVVGVPDRARGRGTAPKAFVIIRPGAIVTEPDLRRHLANRISRIEMPADIDFVRTLPRNAFGFVCKRTLREGGGSIA